MYLQLFNKFQKFIRLWSQLRTDSDSVSSLSDLPVQISENSLWSDPVLSETVWT